MYSFIRPKRTGAHPNRPYSLTYIRTMKDIYSNIDGLEFNTQLIKTKPSFKQEQPKIRLKQFYRCEDNTALVRKIYLDFLYECIKFVINGKGSLIMPETRLPGILKIEFKHKFKTGRRGFNSFLNNRKLPHLTYVPKFRSSTITPYSVHITEKIYKTLIDNFNNGIKFNQIPKSYKVILPIINEKYSCLDRK